IRQLGAVVNTSAYKILFIIHLCKIAATSMAFIKRRVKKSGGGDPPPLKANVPTQEQSAFNFV
uniref:hypothetical protein n=1 Tax=Kosakonia cowanii TaxID=208223 RepID=UPI0028A07CFA